MIWSRRHLSQQYVVNNHVKIETQKLRWYKQNQDAIRVEQYQGLQDDFHKEESDTSNVNFALEINITFINGESVSLFINDPNFSSYI